MVPSQVHKSLVHADNALMMQGSDHPDGWGVAYYVANSPHIIKSARSAIDDHLFQRVSGIVSALTVIAHLRKATAGDHSIINSHPFQYGRWVFAHNGNIKNFDQCRDHLLQGVHPNLRRFILGDTDSEIIFYLILTHLSRHIDLNYSKCELHHLKKAAAGALNEIQKITGPFEREDKVNEDFTYLTFIMSNGEVMFAHQGGKELHYSTYKSACSEKDQCPSYAHECENPTKNGHVNHLVLSSEVIDGENIWIPLKPGEVIGVDSSMNLDQSSL